jgi:hypothetical protein
MAIQDLSEYVKAMDPEHNDAAVFGPDGMVANAKVFLDENDQYIEQDVEDIAILGNRQKPIYIIGNPLHRLGFMVASPDDPLGYDDPAEALSDLGQMRKDHGNHLKLYRVEPVSGPVLEKNHLEQYNADQVIEDFEYTLVNEYLKIE